MSSIESTVLELEEKYTGIRNEFNHVIRDEQRNAYGFAPISEHEIIKLLRDVMSFQRSIESSFESVQRLSQRRLVCKE